jgi:hypothetical protein
MRSDWMLPNPELRLKRPGPSGFGLSQSFAKNLSVAYAAQQGIDTVNIIRKGDILEQFAFVAGLFGITSVA